MCNGPLFQETSQLHTVYLCSENHTTMKRNEGNLYILTRKDPQDTLLKQISKQNRKCESVYTGVNSITHYIQKYTHIHRYVHTCALIHIRNKHIYLHIYIWRK